MRVPQRGQIFPLVREGGQRIDAIRQPLSDQSQCIAHDDQVGVIDNKLTRRPEMDDTLGRRRGFFKCMHMGHHVMPQLLFPLCRPREVDGMEGGLHLLKRFGADSLAAFLVLKPQLALAARQFEPEAAPEREFMLR